MSHVTYFGSAPPNGTPSSPTPQEVRTRLMEDGDLRGLYEMIVQAAPRTLDRGAAYEQLRVAVENASRHEGADFCDQLFRSMLAFAGFAMLRLQHLCLDALDGSNQRLAEDFHTLFPLVCQAQAHVTEMVGNWATTMRVWKLGHRNEREAAGDIEPRRPRGRAKDDRSPKQSLDDLLDAPSSN